MNFIPEPMAYREWGSHHGIGQLSEFRVALCLIKDQTILFINY